MTGEHTLLYQARRDLEKATSARDRAEASLRAAEQELLRLKLFIEQYEIYLGEGESSEAALKWRFRTKNLTNFAVSIIEKSEDPLSIQDILERLHAEGVVVGGENKTNNLAAYLSKDSRVFYEKGVGWTPKNVSNFQNYANIREESTLSSKRMDSLAARRRGAFSPVGADRAVRARPADDFDEDTKF